MGTLLNVLLLALGIATLTVLLLLSRQVETTLARGADGIDFVVGAKGSPLQLILSSIYHIDSPTGNIPRSHLDDLRANRAVARALPLALGDSYGGFRIVGTETGYVEHYGGAVTQGALWGAPREVVLGARVAARTGLGLGDTLVSAHGLSEETEAYGHEEAPLTVVGVLAPGAAVLDGLILTAVETVWDVHGLTAVPELAVADTAATADSSPEAGVAPDTSAVAALPPPPGGMPPPPGAGPGSDGRDLTAILVTVASPIAVALLPRQINAQTNAQTAVPAQEIQRLLRLLGVGFATVRLFGAILLLAAALSVFIALTNAMRARRTDLAILRSLGAHRRTLLALVLTEGLVLTTAGLALGLLAGHALTEALGRLVPGDGATVPLTGLTVAPAEGLLIALVLAVGVLASLLPALRAYRTDVAGTLAQA
jgi:putative ABC transport system permease protein